jgi:hypothetical protein
MNKFPIAPVKEDFWEMAILVIFVAPSNEAVIWLLPDLFQSCATCIVVEVTGKVVLVPETDREVQSPLVPAR